ncbi:hypothetical protein ACRAWF_20610 [Streptomyces sp. L7]
MEASPIAWYTVSLVCDLTAYSPGLEENGQAVRDRAGGGGAGGRRRPAALRPRPWSSASPSGRGRGHSPAQLLPPGRLQAAGPLDPLGVTARQLPRSGRHHQR